jgi:hypothetical protein
MNNLTVLVLLPVTMLDRERFIDELWAQLPGSTFFNTFEVWLKEYIFAHAVDPHTIGIIDTAALSTANRLTLKSSLENGSVGRNIIVLTHLVEDLAIPAEYNLQPMMAKTISPHELFRQIQRMHEKFRQTA